MFETLSQGFSNALEKLTKQGVLREDEISTALREVRIALLEADVSLEITKRFVKSVGEKALPFPLLSTGASVIIVSEDFKCVECVLSPPRYRFSIECDIN